RGGAALSIRYITGKPIKFLGVGEKTEALEPFYPERVASRILGMGDILSLIEEAEQKVDREKAEKMVKKLKSGQGFNLQDFRDQMRELDKMGGVASMVDRLPGLGTSQLSDKVKNEGLKMAKNMGAIIDSMTMAERLNPDVINPSRKRRIAMGAGTDIPSVNRVLKQFAQMQKMMKKMGNKKSMMGMMRGAQALLGGGGHGPFPQG
ncbi:MAG: signal recognition particle protein, partial [Gammaproteobacteria bacterium]|nr:signal recognition particle protein [Gammaproteobacteria bacterium]